MKPKLSVLVPTYNRAQYVVQAIESVLRQSFSDLEIICSDNGSTDDTLRLVSAIAAEDRRLRLLTSSQNLGPIPNWARCLAAAQGDYVHWMWSDDYANAGFYEEWLKKTSGGIDRVPFCSAAYMLNESGDAHASYMHGDGSISSTEALRYFWRCRRFPVSPAAYVLPATSVRKHFYDRIPVTRHADCIKNAIGPDLLMIVGAIMDAGEVRTSGKPLVTLRCHSGSISRIYGNQLAAHYGWALCWFAATHEMTVDRVEAFRMLMKGFYYRSPLMLKCASIVVLCACGSRNTRSEMGVSQAKR